MTSFDKVDVILQNPVMRAEAESLLHGLFATEVMPFMKNYDAFVNAKTDVDRGAAYAEIYEKHLRDGSDHYINVYDGVVQELKKLGKWEGPMPANSPIVGKLEAALVEVKKLMYGALNVQDHTNPYASRAHELLRQVAQPPAPTKSGRTSLTNLKSFLTRGFTHSSAKKDSPPASSGSSSPKSVASAEAPNYINMDAVLASPGATRDLRAFLRRGKENQPVGVGTENLDFLESYVEFRVAADPAAQRRLLAAMIDRFVRLGSPSELQLGSIGFRGRVVRASTDWIGDPAMPQAAMPQAAMPQALVDDLATARGYIERLLERSGGGLDRLRKELFPVTE